VTNLVNEKTLQKVQKASSFESPTAKVTSDNHDLIDVRASRLIPGLVSKVLWVPTAIVPFLSTPSFSVFPSCHLSFPSLPSPEDLRTDALYTQQIGGTSAVGRLSGFKRYPLRKLARWRTNQLLIKPLSFWDGRYGDRGDAVNRTLVCCWHKENRITLEFRYSEASK